MTSTIRTLYLYIVSFITLGMIVGGIYATVYNFSSYFYPTAYEFFNDDTDSYYYENNKDYITDTKNNYKREKIKDGIVSVVVVALGGVLYKYHWNIIEKN